MGAGRPGRDAAVDKEERMSTPTHSEERADGSRAATSSPQLSLALELRDEAMDRVSRNAGESFKVRAINFVVRFLGENGATAGEDITDAAKKAGIIPHDDRAFGPVYMKLYNQGHIVPVGDIARRKGHGTHGGRIWSLANTNDMPHPSA